MSAAVPAVPVPSALAPDQQFSIPDRVGRYVRAAPSMTLYRRLPFRGEVESLASFSTKSPEERQGFQSAGSKEFIGLSLTSLTPSTYLRCKSGVHASQGSRREDKVPAIAFTSCEEVENCSDMITYCNAHKKQEVAVSEDHKLSPSTRKVKECIDFCAEEKEVGTFTFYYLYSIAVADVPPEFTAIHEPLWNPTHYLVVPTVLFDWYQRRTPTVACSPAELWNSLNLEVTMYGYYSPTLAAKFRKLPYLVMKGGADPTDDFDDLDDDDDDVATVVAELIRQLWPHIDESNDAAFALCERVVRLHRCRPPFQDWQLLLSLADSQLNKFELESCVAKAKGIFDVWGKSDSSTYSNVLVMDLPLHEASQPLLFSEKDLHHEVLTPPARARLCRPVKANPGSAIIEFDELHYSDALSIHQWLRQPTVMEDIVKRARRNLNLPAAEVGPRDEVMALSTLRGPTTTSMNPNHRFKVFSACFQLTNRLELRDIEKQSAKNSTLFHLLCAAVVAPGEQPALHQRVYPIFLAEDRIEDFPLEQIDQVVDKLFPEPSAAAHRPRLTREVDLWFRATITSRTTAKGLSVQLLFCRDPVVFECCRDAVSGYFESTNVPTLQLR